MEKTFITPLKDSEKEPKNTSKRKPRPSENTSLFHTFSQTESRTKNQITAEKILEQIGLSFAILEEKYKNVTDCIYIFDLSGCTLWMNKVLRETIFFKKIQDPYMMHTFRNFIGMNENNPSVYKSLKNLLVDYPATLEMCQNVKTSMGEFFTKNFMRRLNKENGEPLCYLLIGRYFPIRETEDGDSKKKAKTKKEIIRGLFNDNGITEEVFFQYKDQKDPIIFIDLLGKVLWANESFYSVYLKCEDDLMECNSHDYGFEVYHEALQTVIRELPKDCRVSEIDFKRFETKEKRPFGFLVTFKSLVQTPLNLLDITDAFLERVGFSHRILTEKYGKSESLHCITSLQSKLLWMNEKFYKITKRNNENSLMIPLLFIIASSNPDIPFFKEEFAKFYIERGRRLVFSTEINLSKSGTLKGKFTIERIDTYDGTPHVYHWECNLYEF